MRLRAEPYPALLHPATTHRTPRPPARASRPTGGIRLAVLLIDGLERFGSVFEFRLAPTLPPMTQYVFPHPRGREAWKAQAA